MFCSSQKVSWRVSGFQLSDKLFGEKLNFSSEILIIQAKKMKLQWEDAIANQITKIISRKYDF